MEYEAFARTDIGRVRENNEDSMLVDVDNGIFIVADGMGGHAAGEVASAIAVEVIHKTLMEEDDPEETRLFRRVEDLDRADLLRERMRYAMNQASVQIRQEARMNPQTRGMGTTVVLMALDGEHSHVAHAGDSRAYLVRGGRLIRLTRDHTVVQQEIDAGRLTPDVARLAPHKHILTQSIGIHGAVEPDTSTRRLEAGDLFLLCSDGLNDALDDEQIETIVQSCPSDMLHETLIDEALQAGAKDNVTVVVVCVS